MYCTSDATVELLEGTTVLATGTCEDYTISLTSSELADGDHSFSARETDDDGVRSTAWTKVEVITSDEFYNDSQKHIAIGQDGFARFVYFDNDYTDVHFVQCLDVECTTKNNTTIASNVDGVDQPTIVMASDGLARISYINWNDPNELHYIQCTNAACSEKTDNLVATGSYYEKSFTLDANDNAVIIYNDYDTSTINLAYCADEACSSATINTDTTFNYGSAMNIAIAPDGFARFAYFDNDPSYQIHYVQCTNADCSTNVNTEADEVSGSNGYYVDMVLDSDGYGRIVYNDYNTGDVNLIQCTNAACSTSNTVALIDSPDTNTWNQVSIALDSNDLPRIVYGYYSSLEYVECTNASCSTSNTHTIDAAMGYTTSIAIDENDSVKVIFDNEDDDTLYLAHPLNTEVTIESPVRHSGGGYVRPPVTPASLPPVPIPAPDCLPNYLFSPSTGKPCSSQSSESSTPPTCIITLTLKQGMTNEQVKCLQTLLLITSDGIFGPKTKAAVILFQKAHLLTPDGIVGTLTKAKLMME
jgi:hypothetical protein